MSLTRREFLQAIALLAMTPGCSHRRSGSLDTAETLYSVPLYGNVRLLHFTDCHAQLLPIYYREPAVNIGIGDQRGRPPHLTGRALLDYYRIAPDSAEAYALTHLNFSAAAELYGKMGGFAHLATLIERLRAERGADKTLLLDGGDSWQGSATALWTEGQDMMAAAQLLGVNVMTGHWEFTYGRERMLSNLERFGGEFVAQNVEWTETARFFNDTESDRVFKPYTIRILNGVRIAVIGQAFPYTPIANPKRFVPDWRFGINESHLQTLIHHIQVQNKADVIVLLSHNGMDVDLKLASRIAGLDIVLGGHTHDAIPKPVLIDNPAGKTWVTNAGSHGKFLAVLDLTVGNGRLLDVNYRLLPVFANLLPPDPAMQSLINAIRKPYLPRLTRELSVADKLLYRRDTFQGTFDRLILNALREAYDAEIAFSPGFRWGTTRLPGQTITIEDLMNHTAITYPETYVRLLSGGHIKTILEDVADNLFNPDPYYRQGGDMVRVGGMRFTCQPEAGFGYRIDNMTLDNGTPIEADKHYKVAGWAAVGEQPTGRPVWDVLEAYLLNTR